MSESHATSTTSPAGAPTPITLPDAIPERFRGLFLDVAVQWASGRQLYVVKALTSGKSGASVTILDIFDLPASGTTNPILTPKVKSGQYVLKMDEERTWPGTAGGHTVPEPSEHERHAEAVTRSSLFAKHIPALITHLVHSADTRQAAMLYDLAYNDYNEVTSLSELAAGPLASICKLVSRDLLTQFNSDQTTIPVSAQAILADWLGYRLDSARAPSLHKLVRTLTNEAPAFAFSGEVLLNPLWLCHSQFADAKDSAFYGMIHGDLHPGNVLVRSDPNSRISYWIIDFALCRSAPLFYDHSYLEFGLFRQALQGLGIERLYGLLRSLEAAPKSAAARNVPPSDLGVLEAARELRRAADEWQRKDQPKRSASYQVQQQLARVAVGLNWANKPLPDRQLELALAYAGWAAKRYLQKTHPSDASAFLAKTHSILSSPNDSDTASTAADATSTILSSDNDISPAVLWDRVWNEADKFDESISRFILVVGRLGIPDSASLGLLPWAAVIDLDPESDEDGLFSKLGPTLRKSRFLRRISRRDVEARDYSIQLDRATSWLMAGGWPSRHEPVPTEEEWRRNYVPLLRSVLLDIRKLAAPRPVKFIVMPGPYLSGARLELILGTIDEVFQDPGKVILLTADAKCRPALAGARFDLAPEVFAHGVRRKYGAEDDAPDCEIPGVDGPVSLSVEFLRNLESDLEVLHSRTLIESAARGRDRDAYWRGTQPTWLDLHAGLDARRTIHNALADKVSSLLVEGGNQTLEFHHTPGAGGTTVALRCAWSMRHSHPVLILRQYSKLTAERIAQLYQIAQKPVLLVADASLIPVANRGDLFRELSARRVRSLVLYVVRTVKPGSQKLVLRDPMDQSEGRSFYQIYSQRTSKIERKRLLKEITESKAMSHLRSAFFYGLATYEHEFRKVDQYVDAHLREVSVRPLEVLTYLALVTRYSQAGVDEAMVRVFCGYRADAAAGTEAMFDAASQLIQQQHTLLRVTHPVIAEHVLAYGLKGSATAWKARLKDLSIKFIHDLVAAAGADSDVVRRLLVSLYIRRDYASHGQNFSELLRDIGTSAGQHEVLEELTKHFPDEAHFWNHLGRHQIYEMRSDYEKAEQYLERAVQLSPGDSLHFHTLGMVRRLWIERMLDRLFASKERIPSADKVLKEIETLASSAGDAFRRARELRKEDEHGYVTHVQLIAEIAQRLMATPEVKATDGMRGVTGPVGLWLQQNLVVANDLLEQIRQFRPNGDAGETSSHLVLDCESKISEVLGGLDQLIDSWEKVVKEGHATFDLRRALSRVYYRRRRRVWASLSVHDLRRIAEHSEIVLNSEPGSTQDAIMWFQSYRRLPEFSYVRALDVIGTCAALGKQCEAYYYLYILHYLLWRQGHELDEVNVKNNLDLMKSVRIASQDYSFEWLATGPEWCPLLHHRDMEWQPTSDKPNPSLIYVDGTIDSIKGPQSGQIRLGRQTTAFFIPGVRFHATDSINEPVHLYLGFSYEGLRAWHVKPGPSPKQ